MNRAYPRKETRFLNLPESYTDCYNNTQMMKFNKSNLRRSLLKTRQCLYIEDWQEKSKQICQVLEKTPQFCQAKTILAYFSFREEPDLSSLFTSQHQWGFSRCVGKSLSWHLWTPETPLQQNSYGIWEPSPDSPLLKVDEVDLILVPAIACDQKGYRLGYGGGFYDRLLKAPEWQSKLTIGIVFDFAFWPYLPRDPWDQPLHGVCTETELQMF
mgnify:CR=1 FL=1